MQNGKAHPCACSIERKISAKLPERYRKASLDDFHADVSSYVVGWLVNPTDGLLITGPAGTGKTHLAAAILRYLVQRQKDATFRRCARFYSDVRETYRTNDSEATVLKPLVSTRFLILDDMGAGSLSDHERRSTLEVLDQRLNANRPTIVTSNWDVSEISAKMDDRIGSRVSSFAGLTLSGMDRRTIHAL